MAKRGRPTAFKPEYSDLARKFCLLGATNDDLARVFEVSPATIDNWLASIPEFLGSVKEGREEADARVAESLYRRAIGYSHPAVKIFMPAGAAAPVYAEYMEHYAPDTAAAFIWLKNRRKDQWRDKSEVAVTHHDDLTGISDSDLADRLERVSAALRGGEGQPKNQGKLH